MGGEKGTDYRGDEIFKKRPVFGQNVIPGIEVFDKAPENEAAGAARGKDVHL